MKYIVLIALYLISTNANSDFTDSQIKALAYDQLEHLTNLDGVWEGTLQQLTGNLIVEKKFPDSDLKIVVNGEESAVFVKENGKWDEVKPGKFTVTRHKTNAVILAIDSGDNKHWVETWNISVTSKEPNVLLIYLVRVVNNYILYSGEETDRFTFIYSGTLKRVNNEK